jgi:hypothetical protein
MVVAVGSKGAVEVVGGEQILPFERCFYAVFRFDGLVC